MWYIFLFCMVVSCGVLIGQDLASNEEIPMQSIGKAIELCEPNGGLRSIKADGKTAFCVNDARITFK